MEKYAVLSLKYVLKELGEEKCRKLLSHFYCKQDADIEKYIRDTSIDNIKKNLAVTFLVVHTDGTVPYLAGFFTLVSKYVEVPKCKLTHKTQSKLERYATYYEDKETYGLAIPLIAQLAKNSACPNLISGDDLLEIACKKVEEAQAVIGGKFVYIERDDSEILKEFYERNGFSEFGERTSDNGRKLIQMLKLLQ